jgi:SAM-dependent methyltransferase
MATDFTHSVRAAELELAIPLLPPGSEILEFGAGDGWQASELQRRGFSVTAIDACPPREGQHHPVASYDGSRLPYPDASFDVVFSSNVLEHVAAFGLVQSELARVLRAGGTAVHCLPSATWRLWTSLGHPLYAARWAARLALSRLGTRLRTTASIASHGASAISFPAMIKRGLWPHRHGEHGSALSELWLFSRRAWERRFARSGWRVVSIRSTHLCYTGNELFGLRVGNRARARMSRIFGSSTLLYVVEPQRLKGLE